MQMASIIDPLVYADRLTMPKLVIDAGGDEFFMVCLFCLPSKHLHSPLCHSIHAARRQPLLVPPDAGRDAPCDGAGMHDCAESPHSTHMTLCWMQDAEHSMATGVVEVVQTATSFIEGVLTKSPRPSMSWDYVNGTTSGSLTLYTSEPPLKVHIQ
jgi:hypothetical protein